MTFKVWKNLSIILLKFLFPIFIFMQMLLSHTNKLLMPLLENNNVMLPTIWVGGRFSCRGGIFSRKSSHPGGKISRGGIFTFTPVWHSQFHSACFEAIINGWFNYLYLNISFNTMPTIEYFNLKKINKPGNVCFRTLLFQCIWQNVKRHQLLIS